MRRKPSRKRGHPSPSTWAALAKTQSPSRPSNHGLRQLLEAGACKKGSKAQDGNAPEKSGVTHAPIQKKPGKGKPRARSPHWQMGRRKNGPPLSGAEALHSIHSRCQGQPHPAAKHSSSPMRTRNHAHFLQEPAVKLRNILAGS